MELVYSFRGLVHYHHDDKHGSVQADMVLEEELSILQPEQQTAGRETESVDLALAVETSKSPPPPTKEHTPFNKATPTPTRPHLLMVALSLGL